MKQRKNKIREWKYCLTGAVTLVFMLVTLLGFYLVQTVMLQNAQNLGNQLASRYTDLEFQDIRTAELLLTVGAQDLEDQIEAGDSSEELELWVEKFFQNAARLYPDKLVSYAVIGERLFTSEQINGIENLSDLKNITWYEQVMASDGNRFISTSEPGTDNTPATITIAQKCKNSSNIIAFALHMDNAELENAVDSLPAGCSYYLCNAEGQLLFAKTQLQVEQTQLQGYISTIFQQIKSGRLSDAQEYIYGLLGEKRAVYSHTNKDGGVSIITIPYSTLLGDLRQVFYLVMSICLVILIFLVFLSIRDYRLQKRLSRVNETVSALGNLYYSIYRINWGQGTYETIKTSADISQCIPAKGQYEQLLEVVGKFIDQDTFVQFKNSFSLENICHLVEKNISDFGGDFRRLFGDEYRWVNVRLLFDASLQHNEAILCFRQVDEEKTRQLQQLQMLENALDRARESESAQEKFFSQMSHDMRTPLSVIISTVKLLQSKKIDAETLSDYLKKIQVSAGHMLELINDILEMSRMEQTDLRLKNDPCDLQETVNQCLSAFQAQAELQNKTLTASFSLTHPRVYGDGFRIQQVLNNLVSNAMKFTEEGDTIQVEVSQPARQEQPICRIVVRDTGIGMSSEFLPQLFTPYARESRFGTQTVLGTGLGMTIVKTIISRMKGQIEVESAPGEGTAFTLTIPMEPVIEETTPSPEEKETDPVEFLRGKRILLVEDFEMNLEIATELLKMCGAQVVQARNGKEALEAFQASTPDWFDVILMDMNMPVMDGCTAAAAIRATDRKDASTIPILAVTANAFAEDISATAQAGMNAHITKPIDLKQLVNILENLKK